MRSGLIFRCFLIYLVWHPQESSLSRSPVLTQGGVFIPKRLSLSHLSHSLLLSLLSSLRSSRLSTQQSSLRTSQFSSLRTSQHSSLRVSQHSSLRSSLQPLPQPALSQPQLPVIRFPQFPPLFPPHIRRKNINQQFMLYSHLLSFNVVYSFLPENVHHFYLGKIT